MDLYVIVNVLNFIHWAMGSQWRDWQRGVEDTEWRSVEGLAERGEDTEWRSVEGLAERGGRTLSGGQWKDWQRGVEDTEWRSVEGLAERGGGH
ncbi:unnamed protein product [Staurois parvus]|uniref:Uncharacterized protein n=1 Tax=Staurois parvus TaxID=386267 RepID=A0ABN9GWR1_9NEOB|nr:unnamed protein product [Staurois parvus]